MKKNITIAAACLMAALSFSSAFAENESESLKIVTTIFPEYDWVKEVLGDKIEQTELTMLLDNGIVLHNYQPTVSDMVKLADCDVFIYVGGESDEWVEDALAESTPPDLKVINLLEQAFPTKTGCITFV